MRMEPQELLDERVTGTSRQRVKISTGVVLERQNVYLKPEAWETLAVMSREQGVSGSVLIARLIWKASRYLRDNRQVSK